jgi:hypothetical protein
MTNFHSAVTSVGGDCQVGWQIRRHFDNPIPSPFDWIVTPLSSLVSIVTDKGARFGQAVSKLPAVPPFTKESNVCREYGCSYHHDFLHDEHGNVTLSEATLADVRGKMLHKWDAFETAVNRVDEVLFVRLGSFKTPPFAWSYLPETETLLASQVNGVQRLLARTFPKVRCRLLQVIYPETTPYRVDDPLNDMVQLRTLPLVPGANWEGIEADWSAILADFKHYGRKTD